MATTTFIDQKTIVATDWLNEVDNIAYGHFGGGTEASGGDLTITSTSHATKGNIFFGSANGLNYDETNVRLSIGADEQTVVLGAATLGAKFSSHTVGATDLVDFAAHRHTDTAGFGAHIITARSRGTDSAETVVQSGDMLGRFVAVGHDGTDYEIAATIDFEVDGTPGAGDMPGRITFNVTPDGAASPVEAMRITNAGVISINEVAPSSQHLIEVGYDASFTSLMKLIKNGASGVGLIVGNDAWDTGFTSGITLDVTTGGEGQLKQVGIGGSLAIILGTTDIITVGSNYAVDFPNLPDNVATAFQLSEGARNYLVVDTTNAAEVISIGNATTNPNVTILGSGSLTASGGGALTGTWSNLGSVTTIDINGGTIDGTAIGSSTPSTAAFTTVSASGNVTLSSTLTMSGTNIIRDDTDSFTALAAGTSITSGGNILLYGATHATLAGDIYIRSGSDNYVAIDDTAKTINIGNATDNPAVTFLGTGDVTITDDLHVDSGATGSGSVFGGATSGAQGAGTINAKGYYVDGSPVSGVTNGDSHDHNGGDGATIDTGALAADAVTSAKLDNVVSSDSGTGTAIGIGAAFTPTAGMGNYKTNHSAFEFQMYNSSAWRGGAGSSGGGFALTDGSNQRYYNNTGGVSTIHYQYFNN